MSGMSDQRSPPVHNRKAIKVIRKKLRSSLTPAEATLWNVLKSSGVDGRKFRRQHSVNSFVLDFYCASERLGIELDGEVHFTDTAREKDAERTWALKANRIKILRFENRLVFEDLEYVLHRIRSEFGWWEKLP